MIELLKALRKARSEFPPVVKDQENPFFHSKYAALDSIIRAVTPALDDNDLTLLAGFEVVDGKSAVWMELHHDSGESLPKSTLLIPVKRVTKTDSKTGEVTITEDNPQDVGSGISYMVRYSIKTYLGLPLEDDDGNRASGNRSQEQRRQPQQPKSDAQSGQKTQAGNEPPAELNELRKLVLETEMENKNDDETRGDYRKRIMGKSMIDMSDPVEMQKYLDAMDADEDEAASRSDALNFEQPNDHT